jgi:hydroxyacylglutathione hydrolase
MDIIVNNTEMKIQRLELGAWATNTYIVVCNQTGKSAVIDVPPGVRTIINNLSGTDVQYVLLTHNHIDHIAGLKTIRAKIMAPLAVHKSDNQKCLPFSPEILLKDNATITVGKLKIKALHTPGHTPGSICFLIGNYLLSGDTIFRGGPGRTVTPADFRRIVRSITRKIFTLPDETSIHPGHGESTLLKTEKDEFEAFTKRPHDNKLCGDIVWLTS